MALKHIMINDIIAEQMDRIQNLKKYYPFFVLYENTFSQFKEGKFSYLDMGYITLASLRFLINENNFHEKEITYDEYEAFLLELLHRDFSLQEEADEERELALYIFDKLKNDGKAFEFRFFDPEEKKQKISRVKLIESTVKDGQVFYHVTSDGIEFYLDTKEVKDESKINIQQLLLEKMIRSDNFKGGIDVVRRINREVLSLKAEKETVIRLLRTEVYEGAAACEKFMEKTAKWFAEEQRLFAKNKALVDKAIQKAQADSGSQKTGERSGALAEISQLETELKKTIFSHSELIAETAELSQISDQIISRAKLRKLRPVFDFHQTLNRLYEKDRPQDMEYILKPLFSPKLFQSFSILSIDNLLTLKADDGLKGETIERQEAELDFKYDDEKLDLSIGRNFAMLFAELLQRLEKWDRVTLKEWNAILEIKFGEEIYKNRDYYAFLIHLSGKNRYSMEEMQKKPDTMLEEMVLTHMSDADKERYRDMGFTIDFGDEQLMIGPEDPEESDGQFITDMIFERSGK